MITVPVERDARPLAALEAALRRLRLRFDTKVFGLVPSHPIDIVFPNQRVAVDVRSCYWHMCPDHAPTISPENPGWDGVMRGIIATDATTVADLRRHGWTVHVVWEHEDLDKAAARIASSVRGRRNGHG